MPSSLIGHTPSHTPTESPTSGRVCRPQLLASGSGSSSHATAHLHPPEGVLSKTNRTIHSSLGSSSFLSQAWPAPKPGLRRREPTAPTPTCELAFGVSSGAPQDPSPLKHRLASAATVLQNMPEWPAGSGGCACVARVSGTPRASQAGGCPALQPCDRLCPRAGLLPSDVQPRERAAIHAVLLTFPGPEPLPPITANHTTACLPTHFPGKGRSW